jgi:ubiquinone/menaquinone biosynthesis C-methylase UbiE
MDPPASTLSIADAWTKYDDIESRLTASLSERMLDLAHLRPGMRVIDIASGRGEPSLRAARRVGPQGHVLGVDISESLLAMARAKAVGQSISNIEFRTGDAESLDGVADRSFDAATARWGLGSMQSPRRALESIHRVLESSGVLVATFWAELDRVPWASLARRTLRAYRDVPDIDPDVPGAFRHADPSRIVRDFGEAGFTIERVEEIDIAVIEAATAEEIVAWTRDLGLARLAEELPLGQQAAWATALASEIEQFRVGDMIRLGGVTRLVVGRSTA